MKWSCLIFEQIMSPSPHFWDLADRDISLAKFVKVVYKWNVYEWAISESIKNEQIYQYEFE